MGRRICLCLLLIFVVGLFASELPLDSSGDIQEELYYWYNNVSYIETEGCSLVNLEVCVINEYGDYVRDLDLDNFTFIDNGDTVYPPELRQLSECPSESVLVDIIFMFDLSTSMDEEVTELRDHITEFIDGLDDYISYRIAYWTYNGCPNDTIFPRVGVREPFLTDFSSDTCEYDALAPDYWATTPEEAQCLFDAGYFYFYFLTSTYRGHGDEDQYGCLVDVCTTTVWRPEARRVVLTFTDERPIYSADCVPSWGPSDDDLDEVIDIMNDYDIDVFPVTPHDGDFAYVSDASRAYYTGFYQLAEETGGAWFWLDTDDYGAMVDSIAEEITLPPCCYSFCYSTGPTCDSLVPLTINTEGGVWHGSTDTNYVGLCEPQYEVTMPVPESGITTCDLQTISLTHSNPYFGELINETVMMTVNGENYYITDPELSISEREITFTPTVSFESGDTVEFYINESMNIRGCIGGTDPYVFYVDTEAPTCHSYWPEPYDTLVENFDSLKLSLTDDYSGVNFDLLTNDNFVITVGYDTVTFESFTVDEDGNIRLNDVYFPHDGAVLACINDIADSPTYEYCPANTGDCCWEFTLSLEPNFVWFPDTLIPPCDTVWIPLYMDTTSPSPVQSAEFEFQFDPEVCVPFGIRLDGTLTDGWVIDTEDIDPLTGVVNVAISGSEPIVGGEVGVFLYVMAYIPCGSFGGDYCPLEIIEGHTNDGFPELEYENGFIVVDWRWDRWICEMRLNTTEDPGEDLILAIGGDGYATDNYDTEIDLLLLPRVPGQVQGYLMMDDPDFFWITQLRRDMRGLTPPRRWTIVTQNEESGVIRWDRSRLPEGKFYMNDVIDMKLDSMAYYGLNDTIIIDWVTPPLGNNQVCFGPGWNLISVPVLPPRYPANEVFEFSPVDVFRYVTSENRYDFAERMERGEGYWVYSEMDTCIEIGGITLNDYGRQLFRGWNMVGAIAETVLVDDICTAPADVRVGDIYEYDLTTHSYIAVTELVPGKGYWFMAMEEAVLSVPLGGIWCRSAIIPSEITNAGIIEISTANKLSSLSFATHRNAKSSIDPYDNLIPPVAPSSEWNTIASFVRDNFFLKRDISNDAVWALQVYEDCNLRVQQLPNNAGSLDLVDKEGNSSTITLNSELRVAAGEYLLKASTTEIPEFYVIGARPNPFNSAVSVSFWSKEERQANVAIFDNAGRLVETLFNSEADAGINEVRWNAGTDVPSGVYHYRVSSGEETMTGKLLLMK